MNSVSVFFYNQVYGTNGRSLTEFLYTHALHAMNIPGPIERISTIQPTVKTILKAGKPDIVAICEIIDGAQRQNIEQELRTLGYNTIFSYQEHQSAHPYYVDMILATSLKATFIPVEETIKPNKAGHGGGLLLVDFPEIHTTALAVHMPLARNTKKSSFTKQLDTIQKVVHDILQQPDRRFFIFGDFNYPYHKFHTIAPFGQLNLYTPSTPTCSLVPIAGMFYSKCIDYVLGRGFSVRSSAHYVSRSDHKAIYADLQLVPITK